MPESNDREAVLTTPAPPPIETEQRDTMPPGAADVEATRVGTMFPSAGPTYLDEAIRIVAEAGKDIREGRQERLASDANMAENQHAILAAIQKADQNSTANFDLLRAEVRRHREHGDNRDDGQDSEILAIKKAIDALKQEVLDALPDAMTAILGPYIKRLEDLEDEADKLRANARSSPTPPTEP